VEYIGSLDIDDYRFFSLLLFDPDGPPTLLRWSGQTGGPELIIKPAQPKTSSSYKTDTVIASRKKLYAERYAASDQRQLFEYHRSHEPERGPFSVCMHRDDAQTVSFSRIVVESSRIEFFYSAGSPCSTDMLPPVVIPRKNA